jgi:hypothetical protein
MFKSVQEELYQSEIVPHLTPGELHHFEQILVPGPVPGKRYLKVNNQNDVPAFVAALMRINFDTRWVAMYRKKIAKPCLLIQQRNPVFTQSPLCWFSLQFRVKSRLIQHTGPSRDRVPILT